MEKIEYQRKAIKKAIDLYGNRERLCEHWGVRKNLISYYYPKGDRIMQPAQAYRLMELCPTWFDASKLHPDVYPPEMSKLIRQKLKEKQI